VKGYARSNHSRRSENERHGEGVHQPVVALLGSMAVLQGPRRSSSARGYGARETMGARANQRGDHGRLTYAVDALGKAVVRAGGDGFSLQVEADGGGDGSSVTFPQR
jgi:hypothetical protein